MNNNESQLYDPWTLEWVYEPINKWRNELTDEEKVLVAHLFSFLLYVSYLRCASIFCTVRFSSESSLKLNQRLKNWHAAASSSSSSSSSPSKCFVSPSRSAPVELRRLQTGFVPARHSPQPSRGPSVRGWRPGPATLHPGVSQDQTPLSPRVGASPA